jgi:hypothetical protein
VPALPARPFNTLACDADRKRPCRIKTAPPAEPVAPLRRQRERCLSGAAALSRQRAAVSFAPTCTVGVTAERRWSESEFIKYGQWRYQRVEARPRDLRGTA